MNAEVFDVMIVLDKVWTDEDGDVVDDKTIEHEVLGSFETEDEAREFMASLQNGNLDLLEDQETTQERNAEIEASTPEEEREIQNDPEFT